MKIKKRERLTALFLCVAMVAATILSDGSFALAADKADGMTGQTEGTAEGRADEPAAAAEIGLGGEAAAAGDITEPETGDFKEPEADTAQNNGETGIGSEEPDVGEDPVINTPKQETPEVTAPEEKTEPEETEVKEPEIKEPELETEAQTFYTFEDDQMIVEVQLPEGTVLPEGTELKFRQITDHKITKKSTDEEKADKARYDDITELLKEVKDDGGNPVDGFFAYHAELVKDGEVYVPEGEMNIKISYKSGALPEVFTGDTTLKAMNVKAFNYTTVKDENGEDKTVLQDEKDHLTAFAFADHTIGSVQEIGFNAEKVTDFVVAWNGQDQKTEYTYSDDDVTVTANLSKAGILPRGVKLVAEKVEDETALADVQEKIEAKASEQDKTVNDFAAYDIRFEKDGEEVEPDGEVNVSLKFNKAIKPDAEKLLEQEKENGAEAIDENALEDAEVKMYHLNEQGAEVVTEEPADAEVSVAADAKVEEANFTTDSFSIFVISWEGSKKDLTMYCRDTNGKKVGGDDWNKVEKTLKSGLWYSVATLAPEIDGYDYSYARYKTYNSKTSVVMVGLINGTIKYKSAPTVTNPPDVTEDIFLIYNSNSQVPGLVDTLSLPNIDLKVYDYTTNGWAEAVTAQQGGIGTFASSIAQGLVEFQLGADGLPVRTQKGYNKDNQNPNYNKYGDSLKTLFGSSYIAEKTEYNADKLFAQDSDGYYYYDSSKNYAFLEGDQFKVYTDTKAIAGKGGNFYPFNDYNDTGTINNGFGMMMGMQFVQPMDGKLGSEDMVFSFSGDDDVWVFIDGYLVLDMGGSHGKKSGSINFSTGEVKVESVWNASPKKYTDIYGTNTNLKKIAKAIGAEDAWDLDENGRFKDWSSHSFKFFYTDHGGQSNCSLKFNLVDVPKDSISVGKKITGTEMADYTDNDFSFKLYTKKGSGGNASAAKNKTYTLKEEKGSGYVTIGTGKTGSSGEFTLKNNQIAVFNDISLDTYYYVEEYGINSSLFDKVRINSTSGENKLADGSAVSEVYQAGKNSMVMFYNTPNASNNYSLKILKHDKSTIIGKDETFHIKVTLGGKTYTGKYKVDNQERTAKDGYLELKVGESAVISNILKDTSYAVQEIDLEENYYKDPSYSINNGKESNDIPSGAINNVNQSTQTSVDIYNFKNTADFEFLKTDKDTNPLAGATFELTGKEDTSLQYKSVSGADGIVQFHNVLTGSYYLRETEAPYGYDKPDTIWEVTVQEGSKSVVIKENGDKEAEKENGQYIIRNYTPQEAFERSLTYDKQVKLKDWDDRTYQITLSASSQLQQISEYTVPYDIVLVFDNSGSMGWDFYDYVPYTGSTASSKNTYYVKTTNGVYQKAKYNSTKKSWYYKDTASGKDVYAAVNELYVQEESSSKKSKAIEAATSFLDMASQKSEDSRVGVVFFNSSASVKMQNNNSLLRVGNESSMQTLKGWLTKVSCSGATNSGDGMNKAYNVLNGTAGKAEDVSIKTGRRKMVLLMTDGVPTTGNQFDGSVAEAAVKWSGQIKNMESEEGNPIVYSLGIFDSADSDGKISGATVGTIDSYMTGVATSQDYYMNADSIDTIQDVFESIGQSMGKTLTADITDVIDARFELAEGEEDRLVNNTGAQITHNSDGSTTITWPAASIQAARGDRAGWEKTITVRAKDEFIGGNAVYTNADGSGISSDAGSISFDKVPVNVKMDYVVGNTEDVIFWGDSAQGDGLTKKVFDTGNVAGYYAEKTNVRKYTIGRDGNPLKAQDFELTWSKDPTFKDSSQSMTEAQFADEKPDGKSVYYLQVKYNAGDATDASNANTEDLNGNSHQADEKNGDYGTNNQQGLTGDNTSYYRDKDGKTVKYGVYILDIVKGQLKIDKQIDAQYTDIKKINANQSFIFRADRREEKGGEIKDTYYAVLKFDANGDVVFGSDTITGLKKGFYTVTEETGWSSKYRLAETSDNYSSKTEHEAAKDLPIGEKIGNEVIAGHVMFYGTAPGYETYTNPNPAEVKFKNTLKKDWKWLSDASSAANEFTGN